MQKVNYAECHYFECHYAECHGAHLLPVAGHEHEDDVDGHLGEEDLPFPQRQPVLFEVVKLFGTVIYKLAK